MIDLVDVIESKNTVQPGPPMKWCPSCYRYRDVKEFGRNGSAKDGLQFDCAVCQARYAQTEKRKAANARCTARYRKTEKGKAASARSWAKYRQTKHGKLMRARSNTTWHDICRYIIRIIGCTWREAQSFQKSFSPLRQVRRYVP